MNKWIVVTTINPPNASIKRFSSMKGWQCVVVGDEKSPPNWSLEGVHYLSIEKQAELSFSSIEKINHSHYSRKNIGYLYAIQNGADVIWESDDDNIPLTDQIFSLDEKTELRGLTSNSDVVNPYPYFGASDTWPRGYPLTKINGEPFSLTDESNKVHIPIQQGLANGQPDVDAIFRLTKDDSFSFDSEKDPVYISSRIFSPFNSQNTFWYRSAFWGLLLPTSVAMRVCDIWRGYITQRLLWEQKAVVAFLPPTVYQDRNEHNLLADFKEEVFMYTETERLIQVLLDWRSASSTADQHIVELFKHLNEKDLIGEQDSQLAEAWISDLRSIGYNFS